jgi:glycine hydroxymethyltransferase
MAPSQPTFAGDPPTVDAQLVDLAAVDPTIHALGEREAERQRDGLELIASENFTSAAVRAATATVLTNKYAEGYPGKRYYGGCDVVDEVERLAIARARELFGAAWANVQPHSGSSANLAVYHALLQPGDLIMGMDLAHGGHLTHGSPVNFSGQLYRVVGYPVDRDSERIDMEVVRQLALEHRPKMIIAGASAYSRLIDFAAFRTVADEIGAFLLADVAHIAGPIAAGLHPDPVPHAHVVTSTTHKTLRGPRSGIAFGNDLDVGAKVDRAVFPGSQGGPLMHVIAAKAVAFLEALQPSFRAYQQAVLDNARALASALQARGWRIVSGGTDNHLLLVDLRPQGLTGKRAVELLDPVHITVSKSMVPFDDKKPWITSGIRLGAAALTSRGFTAAEMAAVADLLDRALGGEEPDVVRGEVVALARRHPMP